LDKEKPSFTAGIPVDMVLSCEEVLDTFVMTPSQVQDNCSEPTIEFEIISSRVLDPADCGYYNYIDTMRYTLSDDADNACFFDQVVTYVDNTPPLIILPADTTIAECQVNEDVVCRDSIFVIGTVDTTLLISGEWVITSLALKDTVQLCDTTLFAPNDPSLGASAAFAEDNCAPFDALNIYFQDSLDILCKGEKAGIIYRKWFAVDPCGNIDSAVQQITILDKNPPELICNETAIVSLENDGTVTMQTQDVVSSLFDACFSYSGSVNSNIDVNITPSLFNCNDIGEHTVLVSATDPCNNRTSYCEVSVKVIDDIDPQLTCPQDPIVLNIVEGNCRAAAPELNDILGVGDCSVEINTEPNLFEGLPVGTHDVTITATDASGNQSVCVATFIVEGEPVDFSGALSCNNKINISLNAECQFILTPDMLLENDAALCTDFLCIRVEDENGIEKENFFDESDINTEFKVTVVDCNGTQNSCWSTVLIEEKQIPSVEWPLDVDLLCIEPTVPDYFKVGYPEVLNCESAVEMSYVRDVSISEQPLKENGQLLTTKEILRHILS